MTKMLRKIEPSESEIQCAIVEWSKSFVIGYIRFASNFMPGLSEDYKRSIFAYDHLIAIPNGGSRNKAEAVNLKKQGVKSGVSDLFLAWPSGGNHGFWIEIKRRGGKLSGNQIEWINRMEKSGYRAKCIFSVDECINAIKDYLGMR